MLGLLDEVICDYLAGLPRGVPGVAEVCEDGDVYLAGVFVWDCSPYDWSR